MEMKKVRELIKIFEKSEVHKIEVEQDGLRIKLEKETKQVVQATSQVAQMPVVEEKVIEPTEDNSTKVKAPLVGTFYTAPSPDAEPFVSKGTTVKKGDVLCIIEAMKVMNEIQAPESGVVKEILVNNGDMVEFDQVIMKIE